MLVDGAAEAEHEVVAHAREVADALEADHLEPGPMPSSAAFAISCSTV